MHINHWKAGKIKHDEAMLIATAFRKAGATGAIGKRFPDHDVDPDSHGCGNAIRTTSGRASRTV